MLNRDKNKKQIVMKKLLFTFLGISALLLGSCSLEDSTGVEPVDGMKLRVEIPGLYNQADTRAVSEEGEDEANSLYLLFFEPTADRTGRFLDYVEVAMPQVEDSENPGETIDGTLSMLIDTNIDLTGTSLTTNNAYNILAVANLGDNLYISGDLEGWMSQWSGRSENDVMAEARGMLTEGMSIASNSLLMYGRMEKKATENQLHLVLERDMVRFDVYNNMSTYRLHSVRVWNAFPATSIWNEGVTDYSSSVDRVKNLGNWANESESSSVKGRVYAFENVVSSPQANDQVTTCLIVGMKKVSDGSIEYFRVNMLTNETAQILRRNYVYSLTITGINGTGASSEETAYLGKSNALQYRIGQWNLDANGLIVQDEYSILSIPTKTVTIGKEASRTELSIYTFSSLSNPAPLSVRSQTYTPATMSDKINAFFDGETLVIDAQALSPTETERNGVIVITYAGLETSISLTQSGIHDTYLRVILPDGGIPIPRFPSSAGSFSGLITVDVPVNSNNEKEPWTAQLYMEGFSFNNQTLVKTIKSTDGLVTDGKFRVYTHSNNENLRPREAFIVVTLDKDPETYSSVIRLSQSEFSGIRLEPGSQAGVTFSNLGVVTPSTDTNEFEVLATANDEGVVRAWDTRIIAENPEDADKFKVEREGSKIKITTTSVNNSGRIYEAKVRVYYTNDPNLFAELTVTQLSVSLSLSPSALADMTNDGGRSAMISVNVDNWSPSIILKDNGVIRDGLTLHLVNHQPRVILVDKDNRETVFDPVADAGKVYPKTTRFCIEMPKVYYPNRDIEGIETTVTITDGVTPQSITLRQASLFATDGSGNPGGFAPFDGYAGNGSLGVTNSGLATNFAAFKSALATIPGGGNIVTVYPGAVNYVHQTNYNGTATTPWSNTWSHLAKDKLVFFCFRYNAAGPLNAANTALRHANSAYTVASNTRLISGANAAVLNSTRSTSKLYHFLTDQGNSQVASSDISLTATDNASTYLSNYPADPAVIPLLVSGSDSRVVMLVDMKEGFIYLGENGLFNTTLQSGNNLFLDNLMYYISNAAQYGSHFTDMLRDDLQVPAPWDDTWGQNKGFKK
jgi:hypothetical protein